jgi:hypothetical protein
MTASPISRMLPGSLAERHDAHQRPGLDEHRGAGQHALFDHLVSLTVGAGALAANVHGERPRRANASQRSGRT